MTPGANGLPAPLGTLVYRAGLVAETDVQDALVFAERHGRRLGEVLMQRGLVSERDLTNLLASQRGLASVSLADQKIDPAAASLLSEDECRMHLAIPFRFQDGRVVVAVGDPTNDATFEQLAALGERTTVFVVASRSEIYAAIDAHFRDRAVTGVDRPVRTTEPPEVAAPPHTPEPGPRLDAPPAPSVPDPLSGADPRLHEGVVSTPARLGDTVSQRFRSEEESGSAEPTRGPGEGYVSELRKPDPVERLTGAASTASASAGGEPALPERSERPSELDRDVRFRQVDLTSGSAPFDGGSPLVGAADAPPPSAPATPAPQATSNETSPPDGNPQLARFRVVLHIDGGDSVDVDTFEDEAGALAAARTLAGEFADLRGWPRVGRLFIQPSRIRAIEVDEIKMHRGSTSRERWAKENGSAAGESGAGPVL